MMLVRVIESTALGRLNWAKALLIRIQVPLLAVPPRVRVHGVANSTVRQIQLSRLTA